VAPVEAISRGSWKPRPTEPDAHLGYLMISGVLSRTVSVNGSHSAELLDAGNLLRPWQGDPGTVSTISWQALEETRIAVLDPGVAKSIAEHPVLVAALVERASFVVSCDTAIVHFAAAFERPQVALFGPTNPFHWRPRHARAVVLSAAHPHAPLREFTPRMQGAPMERISTALVNDAIATLLDAQA